LPGFPKLQIVPIENWRDHPELPVLGAKIPAVSDLPVSFYQKSEEDLKNEEAWDLMLSLESE
jgi:hypothetical protein